MLWYNCVGSLTNPSTGHIFMLYSHVLIDFLFLSCPKMSWVAHKNRQKSAQRSRTLNWHGTGEGLKHSHWELKRKSWVTALRSHNFFDWLHNPINSKSTHNILLLLLHRDDHLLYQVAGLASSKIMNQGIRKQESFFLPLEIREYYDISEKYCDACFI